MSKTMIPSTPSNSKKTKYKVLEEGLYPARLVRFVGLGVQPQPEFQGQAKSPAFKVAAQWELYDDNDPTVMLRAVEINEEGKEVPTERPSCMFQEMFLFPNAERGKVFDMCKAFDNTIAKSPDNLEWFFDRLGQAAMVLVKKYPKKDGTFGNSITGVQGILPMVAKMMPQATSTLVSFNPYADDEDNKVAYAHMYNFQRDILKQAEDAKNIPLAGTQPIKLDAVNAEEAKAPEAKEEVNPFDSDDLNEDIPF